MRSVRMVVGLIAALCAFGALAGVASAKMPEEQLFFGEFFAERAEAPITEADPAQVKGGGEIEELTIGPYGLKECKVKSVSEVTSEKPSKTFFANLAIRCKTISHPEKSKLINETKTVHFKLGLKFNANKSAEAGEGNEAGTEIVENAVVPVTIGRSACKLEIPQQFLPAKSKLDENHEYESAEYETEEEEVESPRLMKKYGKDHDTLNIFFTLKRLHSVLLTGPKCTTGHEEKFGEGEEEGHINKEGNVEYQNGKLFGELDELSLKNGNIGFSEEEPEEEI